MARIFVCGDIINMYSSEGFIGDGLCELISGCDYAVGNLEGCISNDSESRRMSQNQNTPFFLKKAGFKLLLLANNHVGDYGKDALIRTKVALENNGLKCMGAGLTYKETYEPQLVDIAGIRVGFINLCEAHPYYYRALDQEFGYAWIGDPMVSARIEALKSRTDKIIAFVHGGLEHCTCPLRYFRNYYRQLCDMGVDSVIGSHPHIAQGIEIYKGKLICYSLGNFYFPRTIDADDAFIENHSYSLVLDVNKEKIDYSVVYHKMNNLIVDIEDDDSSPVNIDKLSSILSPENYSLIHEETIRKNYDGLVSKLYKESLNTISDKDSFKQKIIMTIKYWFETKRMRINAQNRHKCLVHLINNETYRFIVSEYYKLDYERERQ